MKEKKVDIKKIDTIGLGLTGHYLFRKKEDKFYIVTNRKEHLVRDEKANEILEKEFKEVNE